MTGAMTRAQSLSSWLRCVRCGRDMTAIADDLIGCSSGHRFDVNRRGFTALLGSRSEVTGDTVPMLDARDTVLESGAFRPIADAIDAMVPVRADGRVIDVGTGTGYYVERLLDSRPGRRALALDRSPAAVARATRRTSADGLVADIRRDWPVRSATADALMSVFAPLNAAEFHRVLAHGGALVVALPGSDHLGELSSVRATSSEPPRDAADLVDELWPWFEHDQAREVRYPLTVTPQLLSDIVGMASSARNAHLPHRVPETDTVTVDVTALRFRRRRRALTGG